MNAYYDIMIELEKLSQVDKERICIELVDGKICTGLTRDERMTIQHIAEEYFNSGVIFWEDFIQIIEDNFQNPRLAKEIKKAYITG